MRPNKQRITTLDQLYAKTEADANGCFNWRGSIRSTRKAKPTMLRYGVLSVEGRVWMAHRYAYSLKHGPIPEGMCVCHKCDNPRCVNTDHLFLGTIADNNRDRKEKGRTKPMYGLDNPRGKLSEDQIVEIVKEPYESLSKISRRLGVWPTTIMKIRKGVYRPNSVARARALLSQPQEVK